MEDNNLERGGSRQCPKGGFELTSAMVKLLWTRDQTAERSNREEEIITRIKTDQNRESLETIGIKSRIRSRISGVGSWS